jgi:hypothetical protein
VFYVLCTVSVASREEEKNGSDGGSRSAECRGCMRVRN